MPSNKAYIHETTRVIDSEGKESITEIEKTISRDPEPEFIKLYTNTWCEFNKIPQTYRELFLQLAMRMSYCNTKDLGNSQLVYTGKPFSEHIAKALNWKNDMYKHGLVALTKCGAIRRVGRGVYQINPSYAGKGSWKYNPHLENGGIKDLRATFDFINKQVKTEIMWADDGENNEINEMWRNGLGVIIKDAAVMKCTDITNRAEEQQSPAMP